MKPQITIRSDLEMSFNSLTIRFQQMLDNYYDELENILRKILDNFDFEALIKSHVEEKIKNELYEALYSINLSDKMKDILFKEIDRKLRNTDK